MVDIREAWHTVRHKEEKGMSLIRLPKNAVLSAQLREALIQLGEETLYESLVLGTHRGCVATNVLTCQPVTGCVLVRHGATQGTEEIYCDMCGELEVPDLNSENPVEALRAWISEHVELQEPRR